MVSCLTTRTSFLLKVATAFQRHRVHQREKNCKIANIKFSFCNLQFNALCLSDSLLAFELLIELVFGKKHHGRSAVRAGKREACRIDFSQDKQHNVEFAYLVRKGKSQTNGQIEAKTG